LDDAQGARTVHSFSERPTWDSAHREPEEAADNNKNVSLTVPEEQGKFLVKPFTKRN
jgi:hypothetical protein